MNKPQTAFTLRHWLSAVLMLAALAWLTVCLPHVNKAQQVYQQLCKQNGHAAADDDNNNPLTNTNEEKNESGASLLSEYLHEAPVLETLSVVLTSFYKCHPSDLYLAYHPELVSPPPDEV